MASDKFMENYRACCTGSKTRLKVKAVARDKRLDFNADRLNAEDWQPLIRALKNDRKLHTLAIKSEYPGKVWSRPTTKEKPSFYRLDVIDQLVESIVTCMKRSEILSTIQLQSLPLKKSHIEKLSVGVKECTSLQNLLLTRFPLTDEGLNILFNSVYPHIGLNTIDFTSCGLCVRGAEIVAKILRTQRLARYDETWKQSLRYRMPNWDLFPGLRRITLNDNPGIGDKGFLAIIHELMDDLWVKAVDVQNCGLTQISGDEAFKLLKTNNTLSVLDLNRNDQITDKLKTEIKKFLIDKEKSETKAKDGARKEKECFAYKYEWLDGSKEMIRVKKPGSIKETKFECGSNMFQSLKSSSSRCDSHLSLELHKTKKVLNDTKRYLHKERERCEELEKEKHDHRTKLSEKFNKEWTKRKQIEKERDKLKKQLHVYKSEGHIPKTKLSSNSSSMLSTTSKKITKRDKKLKENPKSYRIIFNKSQNNLQNGIGLVKDPKSKYKMLKTLKNKRQNYEINNTEQIQIMQKNLDKLDFSTVKKFPAPAKITDTDTTINCVPHNNISNHGTEKKDVTTIGEDSIRNCIKQRDFRDLSPISRSQWIFNKIMIGKSRAHTKVPENSNFYSEKDKSFHFNTTKWEVKV